MSNNPFNLNRFVNYPLSIIIYRAILFGMRKRLTQEDKFNMMTKSAPELLVLKMAAPTITIMLTSAIYSMADTYFVGKIGTSATAGVGITFSLMAIIQAIGFFFGHGSGNYMSRKLGKKNPREAEIMAATGVFSSFTFGAALSLIGLWHIDLLARLLGATDTILPHAKNYMRFILLAAPFMASVFTMNNQLRLQGSAFFGMIGMITGGITNCILDPILIFGFKMGVAGAGLATFISQVLSFSILFVATTHEGNIRIHIDNFTLKLSYYLEIFRGGFPSLCRQGLASIAILALNHSASVYGDAAIAAMSIAGRSTQFAFSILLGIGQGFQPVCGFNYGAGLHKRVHRAFWFCVKFSTTLMTVFGVIGYLYAENIVAFFRKDDLEVITIGAQVLKYQCMAFPLLGWSTLCNMMLQTIGQSLRATILAVARQGFFYLPLLFGLSRIYGLWGIQICQPASDLLAFLLSLPMCLGIIRAMGRNNTN